MSLPPAWVSFLAKRGVGSSHWSTVGRHDAEDQVIFRHAFSLHKLAEDERDSSSRARIQVRSALVVLLPLVSFLV